MRNFIQKGGNVECPAPYAVASGGEALIGAGLFGVASTDTAQGAVGVFATDGVFDLPKAAGAVALGQKLYWNDAARNLTTAASGNPHVAAALRPAAAGAATVQARLNGVVI